MSVIGVCYRTAWRIKHKLIQVMCEREESTVLSGRVEVDDAYLGGQHPVGIAGRGSENKVPFVAPVETNDHGHPLRAVFVPVETFSSTEIAAWARRWLASSATVISDGLACFRAVTEAGCIHEPQIVGTKRKSTEMACFAWVNTLLAPPAASPTRPLDTDVTSLQLPAAKQTRATDQRHIEQPEDRDQRNVSWL